MMPRRKGFNCVVRMCQTRSHFGKAVQTAVGPKLLTANIDKPVGFFLGSPLKPLTSFTAKRLLSSMTSSRQSNQHQAQQQKSFPFVTEAANGKSCTIIWDDGFQAKFHSIWLRHNCHCPSCRHDSGQRFINSASIGQPHNVKILSIHCQDDDTVHFCWSGEDGPHDGFIPLTYLRQHNYNAETLRAGRDAARCNQTVDEIPTISYEEIVSSKHGELRWLKQINEAGVSIVTGSPCEDDTVRQLGEKIGPVHRTIYDEVFVVKAKEDAINVAYLDERLEPHQDLVYFESPPGIQLLHCVKFDESVEGGESSLVDVISLMEDFRHTHPTHFETLLTVPATFQKVHYERENPVHIVNQKPHVKLNHNGEVVAVYWSPPFEGPLAVKEEDVERYYDAYAVVAQTIKEAAVRLQHRLRPGEVLTFNNQRMLHARRQFRLNGGQRELRGCYVNIDILKSQTQVLNNLFGDGKPVKRVGNQCFS